MRAVQPNAMAAHVSSLPLFAPRCTGCGQVFFKWELLLADGDERLCYVCAHDNKAG